MMAPSRAEEVNQKAKLTLGTGVFIPRTGQTSPNAPLARSRSSCRRCPISPTLERSSAKQKGLKSAPAEKAVQQGFTGDDSTGMGIQAPSAAGNPVLSSHHTGASVDRSMSLPSTANSNTAAASNEGATTSIAGSGGAGFASKFDDCMGGLRSSHRLSEPLTTITDVVRLSVEAVQPANNSSCSVGFNSSLKASSALSPEPGCVLPQHKEVILHSRCMPAVQIQQPQLCRNNHVTQPPPPPPNAPAAASAPAATVISGPLFDFPNGCAVTGCTSPCNATSTAVQPAAQQHIKRISRSATGATPAMSRDSASAQRVRFPTSSLAGYSSVSSDMDLLSSSLSGWSPLGCSVPDNTLLGSSPPSLGVLSRTMSEGAQHAAISMSGLNQPMPALGYENAAATAALSSGSFAYNLQPPEGSVLNGAMSAAASSNKAIHDSALGAATPLQQQHLLAALQSTSNSVYGSSPVSSGVVTDIQYPALSTAGVAGSSSVINSNLVLPLSASLDSYSNAGHGLDLGSSSNHMTMQRDAVLQALGQTQMYSSSCVDSGALHTQPSMAATAAAPVLSSDDHQLEAIERQLGQLLQLHQQVSANKAASAAGLARHSLPFNSIAPAPSSAEALTAGQFTSTFSWDTSTAAYSAENCGEAGRMILSDGSCSMGCFDLKGKLATSSTAPSHRVAVMDGSAFNSSLSSDPIPDAVVKGLPAIGGNPLANHQGSHSLALHGEVNSSAMQQASVLGGFGEVYAGVIAVQQQQTPALEITAAAADSANEQQKHQYMRLAASKLEQLAAIQAMQVALQGELQQLLP